MGKRSPKVVALDQVSLDVRTHQILGVVGESGSGKSTLAKCVIRLTEPDSGSIRFHSTDLLQLRSRELLRARRAIQMIYQDPYSSLNPLFSVEDTIGEAVKVRDGAGSDGKSDLQTPELLRLVGLSPDLMNSRPRELSGGQRQRVAIARAMAVEPELLLADEAVSALDVSIQAQILNLLIELRDNTGLTIVLITHDLSVVDYVADAVMVMYLGSVMETGPTQAIFTAPAHPYTSALLRAQPGRHRRLGMTRPALSGEIPSATDIPSGCRFHTRCPFAQDICVEVAPPPVAFPDGQVSWCHFAADVSSGKLQT